jgi:hypothetical protein
MRRKARGARNHRSAAAFLSRRRPLMAELDKRIDPDKGKSPSPGKVAGGVSGNSAESQQHQEDKIDIADRGRSTDPDATPKNKGRTGKTSPDAAR